MVKVEYNNEYGKYSLRVEATKKRGNAVIEECKDTEKIISHLIDLGNKYHCEEVYCTSRDDSFVPQFSYVYSIDSYELQLEKKDVLDYMLIPVTWDNAEIYKKIYNAATFSIDNMTVCDDDEVREYLELEGAQIGLIQYKDKIIGSFTTVGKHEVDSFAIDPKYQGMHLAKGALQCVLNTLEDSAILFVSSRNEKALNLYKSMGFVKGEFSTKFYNALMLRNLK